jgi:hypothetical protein
MSEQSQKVNDPPVSTQTCSSSPELSSSEDLSSVERIFPFLNEILKDVHLPSFIYFLSIIWIFLQMISMSVWNDVITILNSDPIIGKVS